MRHILLITLALAVILAGCGPAVPAPTVQPTRQPAPTPLPDTTPAPRSTPTGEPFADLRQAVADYQTNMGQGAPELAEALKRAIPRWLAARADPIRPLHEQTEVLQMLQADLKALGLRGLREPSLAAADLNGNGSDDLLLAPGWLGLPVLAFMSGREGMAAQALPADENLALSYGVNIIPAGVHTQDVIGQGRPAAVVTYTVPGGSGITGLLFILQWQADRPLPIFQATLITWAGPSTWEFQPHNGAQDIVLTYPAIFFNAYDHKLLPHQTATQTWRYNSKLGRYEKVAESLSPPTTQRQQVNQGELAFQRGDYEAALLAYQRVLTDTTLAASEGNEQETDWLNYARLRSGQMFALLGREDEARAAMQAVAAIQGEGTLPQLARAFLEAYQEPDAAVRAMAALHAIDLYEIAHQDASPDLRFPFDAFTFYYPGVTVAAYLDAHPEMVTEDTTSLLAALKSLGLAALIGDVRILDLNGDGQAEVAIVTNDAPEFNQAHAWLLTRQDGRWRTHIVGEAGGLSLPPDIRALPDGGQAFTLQYDAGYTPQQQVITWDGSQTLWLDPQSLKPVSSAIAWPVVGGGEQ